MFENLWFLVQLASEGFSQFALAAQPVLYAIWFSYLLLCGMTFVAVGISLITGKGERLALTKAQLYNIRDYANKARLLRFNGIIWLASGGVMSLCAILFRLDMGGFFLPFMLASCAPSIAWHWSLKTERFRVKTKEV